MKNDRIRVSEKVRSIIEKHGESGLIGLENKALQYDREKTAMDRTLRELHEKEHEMLREQAEFKLSMNKDIQIAMRDSEIERLRSKLEKLEEYVRLGKV